MITHKNGHVELLIALNFGPTWRRLASTANSKGLKIFICQLKISLSIKKKFALCIRVPAASVLGRPRAHHYPGICSS